MKHVRIFYPRKKNVFEPIKLLFLEELTIPLVTRLMNIFLKIVCKKLIFIMSFLYLHLFDTLFVSLFCYFFTIDI